MRYRLVSVLLLALVLPLSACSETGAAPSFDILAGAQEIPTVISQALSVSHRLDWGLATQDVGDLSLFTLRTVDLDGHPFIDITASAPAGIAATGFWDLAASVTGDEWDADAPESPWTTTLTGASIARDVLVVGNVGLALPQRLAATVEAAGGSARLAEVVALEQQTFFVRDVDGTLWDTTTREPLTAEEHDLARSIYEEMRAANSTPEVAAELEAQWERYTTPEGDLRAQSGLHLPDLARLDGSLDVQRVQALLEVDAALGAEVRNPDQRNCFLFFCQGIRTGYLPRSRWPLHDGFYQYPWDLGVRSWIGSFNMPNCVLNSGYRSNAPIGCAPTAFIGLIQREFVDGTRFFGMTYTGPTYSSPSGYHDNNQVRELARRMTTPNGLHGRPMIAEYMGTCWNSGGSMTVGVAFRDGARGFLRDQGVGLRMVSNISHYAGNVTSAPAKADILIRNIGRNNNPVIAEYFFGVTQGHFSPVTEYAVYDSGANGLNIRTMSHPDEWRSLSGTWGTERGVFALE